MTRHASAAPSWILHHGLQPQIYTSRISFCKQHCSSGLFVRDTSRRCPGTKEKDEEARHGAGKHVMSFFGSAQLRRWRRSHEDASSPRNTYPSSSTTPISPFQPANFTSGHTYSRASFRPAVRSISRTIHTDHGAQRALNSARCPSRQGLLAATHYDGWTGPGRASLTPLNPRAYCLSRDRLSLSPPLTPLPPLVPPPTRGDAFRMPTPRDRGE